MKILKNKILTHVPPLKQSVDDTSDLPYIPAKPLTVKSPAIYICGFSSSGKTTLWNQLLLAHPTKKKPDIPRFYYRFFDRIYLISPSKDTLPLNKLKLNEERIHLKFNNDLIDSIIETEKEGEKVIKIERRSGKYCRSLRLGNSVDESKIAAQISDGVLTLTLPKAQEATSRQIEIKAD